MKSRRITSIVLALACALILASCSQAQQNSQQQASQGLETHSESADAQTSIESDEQKTSAGSSLAEGSSAASDDYSSTAAVSSSISANERQKAIEEGKQVLTGTVRVLNAADLLELQGNTDLNASMFPENGTYAVLVFDAPTNVTGMVADGTGPTTRQAKLAGLAEHTDYEGFTTEYGDIESWKDYDGEQVTVAASESDIMFPTDVSLAIAEPKINACETIA